MHQDHFLDRVDAAAFLTARGLRTSPRTLAKFACIGGGPTYQRFGRAAVYKRDDLIAWAESRLSAPIAHTSETAEG